MVSARDESGDAVDWWFIYKLPEFVRTAAGTKTDSKGGNAYLYFDAKTASALRLSDKLVTSDKGALRRTLQQLEDARPQEDSTLGWYQYNDEKPGASSNSEKWGHTKGVMLFDCGDGTACWLLHSTPRFPVPGSTTYPEKEGAKLDQESDLPVDAVERKEDEAKYGQTFLCISLSGIADAESIAALMHVQQIPQVYDSRVPAGLSPSSSIARLIASDGENPSADPGKVSFTSRAGVRFECLAKSRVWGKDFWVDFVGHAYDVALDVETWRNGTGVVPPAIDPDRDDRVDDVQEVDLQGLAVGDAGYDVRWKFTLDHSKWAVAENTDLLFVADINRKSTQEGRGGGAIAFRDKALRDALASMVEKTAVSGTKTSA